MTEEDLKSHIYTAIEHSGNILRDAMGDSESKSVVVVPVVVVVNSHFSSMECRPQKPEA